MSNRPKPPEDAPDPPEPGFRAPEEERERVVALLGEHAAAGRLTLAELEERAERAYRATTRAELEPLSRDLPERPGPAGRRRLITRWLVAVMSGCSQGGRFRLARTPNAVASMGGDIDLRDAEIDDGELTINACSLSTVRTPSTSRSPALAPRRQPAARQSANSPAPGRP